MAFGRTTASIRVGEAAAAKQSEWPVEPAAQCDADVNKFPKNNPIGAKKRAPSYQVESPAAAVPDQVIVARFRVSRAAGRAVMQEHEHAAISRNPEGTSPLGTLACGSRYRGGGIIRGDDSDVRSSDKSSNKKTPHMRVRTAGPP